MAPRKRKKIESISSLYESFEGVVWFWFGLVWFGLVGSTFDASLGTQLWAPTKGRPSEALLVERAPKTASPKDKPTHFWKHKPRKLNLRTPRWQVYGPDDYILAAIDLYLDIINLFVMLLSLFSNRD